MINNIGVPIPRDSLSTPRPLTPDVLYAIWGETVSFSTIIAMNERIKALWRGQVPLEIAFWRYAVIYGLFLNVTTSLMFMALTAAHVGTAILIAAFLLPVPYNILVIVAVWRSADRCREPGKWVEWARFGTVFWMAALTAS